MNDHSAEYEIAILGCGISGMAAARSLNRLGHRVILVDEFVEPGGNHRSVNIGECSFDVGTIYFPSEGALALLFPECIQDCIDIDVRIERLTPSGKIMRYPFDIRSELLSRPWIEIVLILSELLMQRVVGKPSRSTLDFVRYYVGNRLLDITGLNHFMRRFYGLDISEISASLAMRRMQWVSHHGSLRRRLRSIASIRYRRTTENPAGSFARPRSGFAVMYRRAVQALESDGVVVRLGEKIQTIRQKHDGFLITTAGMSVQAHRIISTIPLPNIYRSLGWDTTDLPVSATLITLFSRFKGARGFSGYFLYNFHPQGEWKRLTMHSDVYGATDGWEYFSLEITTRDSITPQGIFIRFRAMMSDVGLFSGIMEHLDELRTDSAYPIYDRLSELRRDRALAALEEHGIETLGRQGKFDYIASATEAIASVDADLRRTKINQSARGDGS